MMQWAKLLDTTKQDDPSGQSPKRHPDDRRTEFERDYDRMIFTSSFRRLQDKAQVFPLETSDFVRTRLTHTIEVSTLGRSLAVDVGRRLVDLGKADLTGVPKELAKTFPEQIATIVATTSLVHDIGNPPFGHFGEKAIQTWFEEWFRKEENRQGLTEGHISDFLKFEGNAQALRILSRLQMLHHDKGVKLTYGTLGGFLKYPTSSSMAVAEAQKPKSQRDPSLKKPGYFQSELDIFCEVVKGTGTFVQEKEDVIVSHRHPLVYLMEAADDIAYSVIDIEDAVKKGVVSFEQVLHSLSLELVGSKNQKIIRDIEDLIKELPEGPEVRTLRDAADSLQQRLQNGQYQKIFAELDKIRNGLAADWPEPHNVCMQWLRILSHGEMVRACSNAYVDNYDAIMSGAFKQSLIAASTANDLCEAFKTVARKHVYSAPSVLTLEYVGKEVIHGLLDRFVEAVTAPDRNDSTSANGKLFALISPTFRYIEERCAHLPLKYRQLQLVTDFICGMTDTYAVNLYQKLTGMRI